LIDPAGIAYVWGSVLGANLTPVHATQACYPPTIPQNSATPNAFLAPGSYLEYKSFPASVSLGLMNAWGDGVMVEGHVAKDGENTHAQVNFVSLGFFPTLEIRMLGV
jgi:hypothetical protein